MNWIFHNERRMRMTVVGLIVVIVVMLVSLTAIRMSGDEERTRFPAIDTAAPTPEGTSIALQPPSPQPERAGPDKTYGRSDSIALEAVNAWLLDDMRTFSNLVTPEVMEEVSQAPRARPGQDVDDVKTLLGGPTRQKIQVDTTEGPIVLDMIVIDGAWMVRDMRYQR